MQYVTRPALRKQWGVWLICLAFLGLLALSARDTASVPESFFVLPWLGLPVAALLLIIAYRHFSWRFTIQNGVIESRRGIVAREVRSVRVEDVRSINVKQSVLQRILNLGDIEFSSAASDAAEVVFEGISRPLKVKEKIQSMMG